MNVHAETPAVVDDISIGTAEDRINCALNAMLLAHDFVENFCNRVISRDRHDEEANVASYAIGHARERVREAHAVFHQYMAQEFAKREAA